MSLKTRFILTFGLGGIGFLLIITLIVFEKMEAEMVRQLEQQFYSDGQAQIVSLNDNLEAMTERFQSVSSIPMFRSMRFHELTLNKAALKNNIRQIELYFLDFIKQQLPLSQVRFVGKNGAEVFRVDKSGIQRNLSDLSQDKTIKEVLKLEYGQFRITEEWGNDDIKHLIWWIPVYITTMDRYGVMGFSVKYQSILDMVMQLSTNESEIICLMDIKAYKFIMGSHTKCKENHDDFWKISHPVQLSGLPWRVSLLIHPDSFLKDVKEMRYFVFGLVFPMVSVFVLLFSITSSGQIVRSVTVLVNAARTMGRGEKLQPLDIKRNDELGELAKEVNASARMIEEHRNQLIEKNNDLNAYNYTLVHDLRSPLQSITSFTQKLEMEAQEKLSEQERDFLKRIIKASRRMSNLIDDVLELSRISNHEIQLQSISLTSLARTIVDNIRENDKERESIIDIMDNMTVQGDSQLLTLILENLLDNAWKYSRKKHKTVINFGKVRRNHNDVFFIKDNGVGFDMQYVDKLFSPFQRLHKNEEYEGTGIGLASVRRMIERHEGEVWIESHPGQGTTVYFTLWSNNKDYDNDSDEVGTAKPV